MLNAIQSASIASKVVALEHPPHTSHSHSHTKLVGGFASQQLRLPTLLYLATLGGADVCNIAARTGSLEPGKAFDALVVNVTSGAGNGAVWGLDLDHELRIVRGEDSDSEEERKRKELEVMLERFFFCGDDRNIRRVYVQGRFIGGTEFSG